MTDKIKVLIAAQVPLDFLSEAYSLPLDGPLFYNKCQALGVTLRSMYITPFLSRTVQSKFVFLLKKPSISPISYMTLISLEGEEAKIKQVFHWWQKLAFRKQLQPTLDTLNKGLSWLDKQIIYQTESPRIFSLENQPSRQTIFLPEQLNPFSLLSADISTVYTLFNKIPMESNYVLLCVLRDPEEKIARVCRDLIHQAEIAWLLRFPSQKKQPEQEDKLFDIKFVGNDVLEEDRKTKYEKILEQFKTTPQELTELTLPGLFPNKERDYTFFCNTVDFFLDESDEVDSER